jgi:F0F1-type ATP synthase assembly protein I
MPKEPALFSYGKYAALGFEFAGAVLGGILLGSYLDKFFGTGPWGTLLGALSGLVGAVYRLIIVLPKLSAPRETDNNHKN